MFARAKKLIPEPIKRAYHCFQALFGALIFRFPSRRIKVIGVTGTDGKTTTVHLIYHILREAGRKASMISTVEAKIGDKSMETGLHVTTPDPIGVQSLLRKMVGARSEYAVLETTSHGLAQGRVAFVQFFAGVITNVTHEHLDYHKNYREYAATKAKLLGSVKIRVLNADDASFDKIKDQGSGQLVSFGIRNEADFFAAKIKLRQEQSEFEVSFVDKQKSGQRVKITTSLPGEYNIYNILTAFATTFSLGLDIEEIAKAISSFRGIAGRMQYVDEGQRFDCIIDFAHTPAALEAVLKALNSFKKGKIIVVFGCAGERDLVKRPIMGKIATQLADYSIFTAEDPRGENVNAIIEQIAKGAIEVGGIPNRTFWKIVDRAEAINTAIQTLAADGDIVAILGKGHEQSMNIAGKEYPWSDETVVHSALRVKLKR